MAQILLTVDTKKLPNDEDILIWEKNRFVPIRKTAFLKCLMNEIENLNNNIKELENDVISLCSEINKLKAEIAFDRGEITEKEHDELCLGNNG